MAMRAVVLLLALASAAAVREQQQVAASVTPIQKVLTMMNDMLAKAKKEKEDESTTFAEFKQFCHTTSRDKDYAIKKASEEIVDLKADIEQADADAMALGKEIAGIEADIGAWDMELKEATWLREKAHADFEKTNAEYTDSIDSVERAVETIKKSPGMSLAQTSLLELSARTLVPEAARRQIASFIQMMNPETKLMQDAMEAEGSPGPAAFEGHSGGIVEMVEGLGDKFQEERDTLQKEEMQEKHAHDMMAADMNDQMESAKKNSGKKASLKAEREQAKASADGELAETSATLAEDQKFLKDLTAECEAKSIEYDQNQATRQEEIGAIMKAIEIVSSDKVSGAGSTHLPGFVQTGAALTQLRSSSRSAVQGIAASFLAERARMTKSHVLSLLAVKMEADPFKKVVKMIKDMIQKLMEEASEEAEHKGFCDTEMATNKATRDSKSDEVATLTAEIEQLSADVAKLSEDISELGSQISAGDAAMAKATAVRQAEKEKNTATIADAKVAEEAVGQAITVLKEFYDKAAAASLAQQASKAGGSINYDPRALTMMGRMTAMVQTSQSEPYKGMEGGGILGMLDVVQSDFARLLAETTAAESEAAKEYEEFSNDSATDKETKSGDMKAKDNERTKKESRMTSAKKDLAGSQEELDAAMAYFEKLKPSCVDAGESYEERVARRKEEIESLKEALKILSEQ